ncbi:Tol biopolymer transport system component [Mycetocola sp. 2940]
MHGAARYEISLATVTVLATARRRPSTGRCRASLPGNDYWPPAWSPDGGQLAFTADGEENVGEIVVVDLTTLDTVNLTDSKAHDAFPAWRR